MVKLIVAVALSSLSQSTIQIESRPSCRKCEITISHDVRLGTEDGRNALSGPPTAYLRRTNGHYYVVGENDPYRIRVFDRKGNNIKNVGRQGKGPGEFASISALVQGKNDTIYVFDSRNQRLTVINGQDEVVREVRVQPAVYDAELTNNGRFIIAANIASPEAVGFPLHLLNEQGGVVRSFGVETPIYRADAKNLIRRRLSSAVPGRTCSARESEYTIECWRPDGTLSGRFSRQASWFKPYLRRTNITPSSPPLPSFEAIQVAGSGLIWTAVWVPRKDYRRAIADKPSRIEGQIVYQIKLPDQLRSTIIEVIDPSTRRVIASKHIQRLVMGWVTNGLMLTYSEPNGVPYIDIWRTELHHYETKGMRK